MFSHFKSLATKNITYFSSRSIAAKRSESPSPFLLLKLSHLPADNLFKKFSLNIYDKPIHYNAAIFVDKKLYIACQYPKPQIYAISPKVINKNKAKYNALKLACVPWPHNLGLNIFPSASVIIELERLQRMVLDCRIPAATNVQVQFMIDLLIDDGHFLIPASQNESNHKSEKKQMSHDCDYRGNREANRSMNHGSDEIPRWKKDLLIDYLTTPCHTKERDNFESYIENHAEGQENDTHFGDADGEHPDNAPSNDGYEP